MKKNGFVFIETLVVVSVLSLTMVLLFTSYSFIIRKSREKNYFDTTELIYKTYYLRNALVNSTTNSYKTVEGYMEVHKNTECIKMSSYDGYECDASKYQSSSDIYNYLNIFEIEKFYYFNPNEIINNNTWLNMVDATTIDYLKKIGSSTNKKVLIVKYKKIYDDGSYQVYHSSTEV